MVNGKRCWSVVIVRGWTGFTANTYIALASEPVVRVCATAVAVLADVVLVVGARVRSECKGVGVGLPEEECEQRGLWCYWCTVFLQTTRKETHQTSISAQQAPYGPTPALASLDDGFHPSMFAYTSHK